MENDYDNFTDDSADFDDGFDLGNEIETDDGVEDTVEGEIDAVADLLMGDSEKADALAAQRERTGAASKSSRQSINLDANGHKVWHQSSAPEHESKAQGSEYGLVGNDITNTMNQSQAQWNEALKQNARLEQMYQNGEITHQEFEHYSRQWGMQAGIARSNAMMAQIQSYEYEKQRERAYGQLQQNLGDDFSPAKRDDTLRAVAKWMSSQGLSNDYLREVDDPAIVATAYNAMKAIENDKAQRLELAAYKQKVRELNKKLGVRQKKQRKDASIGKRNADAIDQVARLLSDNGIRGGRG